MVGVGVGIAMGKVDLGLVDRLVNFIIFSVVIVVIVVDRLVNSMIVVLVDSSAKSSLCHKEKITDLFKSGC